MARHHGFFTECPVVLVGPSSLDGSASLHNSTVTEIKNGGNPMEQEVMFTAPLMLPLLSFGIVFYALLRSGFSKARSQGA